MDDDADYEDLTSMQLDENQLQALVGSAGECVFNWTTRDGYPVGVVVAYIHRNGHFFTTCAARRKRVAALRVRPHSAVVISRLGRTASYKGDSVVHAPGDDGFQELKAWFYAALSGIDVHPDDPQRAAFAKFLDSRNRVIIETDARLVVAFDASNYRPFTDEVIATGQTD